MSELDIFKDVKYNEQIVKEQYHTYKPRTTNYGNSDEIRISIQHQDIFTRPCESYVHISGDIVIPTQAIPFQLVNNAFSFLFEEIRYELNGVEIDKNRDVGITSTMKGLLSIKVEEKGPAAISGWGATGDLKTYFATTKKFYAFIPLKYLLGFAEDYRKVIAGAKHDLILLRASNDFNCYVGDAGVRFNIDRIEWRVPHVLLSDESKLNMLGNINADKIISIPFRRWELHELPALRQTDRDIWAVKTSTSLEKPRYVIIAFQTNRKNIRANDCSEFDHCNIKNIKVHLNSESYPYDALNLDIAGGDYALAYYMYTKFQQSYYNQGYSEPMLDYDTFKNHMLYVFDVSKQTESIKSSTVDLNIEMEATAAFSQNTRAYCLILYDTIVEHRPLSGTVRRKL